MLKNIINIKCDWGFVFRTCIKGKACTEQSCDFIFWLCHSFDSVHVKKQKKKLHIFACFLTRVVTNEKSRDLTN